MENSLWVVYLIFIVGSYITYRIGYKRGYIDAVDRCAELIDRCSKDIQRKEKKKNEDR